MTEPLPNAVQSGSRTRGLVRTGLGVLVLGILAVVLYRLYFPASPEQVKAAVEEGLPPGWKVVRWLGVDRRTSASASLEYRDRDATYAVYVQWWKEEGKTRVSFFPAGGEPADQI